MGFEHSYSRSVASTIQTVDDLQGPAGSLEALLNVGDAGARFCALVCHPHPPSGGTMHTKVVYHAMKAFSHFGLPVLRFNFRGTGRSAGVHSGGPGEIDDVRAAVDWLDRTFRTPVLLAGFSFGANIGFQAACGDPRVVGLVGLGMPLQAGGRTYSYDFLPQCTTPKLFVTGEKDPFAPRDMMERLLSAAPEPKEAHWVENAEHFFAGVPGSPEPKLSRMQGVMREWLGRRYFPDQVTPV